MKKHLKSKQYYIDLYDRHTVERCRNLVRIHSKPMKNPPLINGKKPTKKLLKGMSKMGLEYALMFTKGDRYINKEINIERWMADDKETDEFYESSEAPEDIRCLKCHSLLSIIHKDLWTSLNKPDRILFMFDCVNSCLPRRAFWDNGEEWIPKSNPCPKCTSRLNSKEEITKEKFITHYTCVSCGFTKKDELKRTANKKDKLDPNFDADRAKYCLSTEEGEKWRRELVNLEQMGKLVDEWKEKDKNKEAYDKVAEINKLTIIELEKLLVPVLEKVGYIKLQLSNPEISKDVIVPFGVYDNKSDRPKRTSEYDLKKLLKKTLKGTNWRLMSDGVSYRLGFLRGRLRGYEGDEDLLKLVK